ncbi:zinc ABC transporter substrate-binding protein [Jannaschia formosa]|uniref:zinc ABC transporter substrate-binding protein n=1 Tax=Jannaschia formosa TaxID=2259592 RepID=UPI000E1BE4C3|nr:zinc ABC transporter substrate-binding protein [Jannaschia formosa]TFL18941.1 zinc transporter [Jannaschia formosa]
MNRSLAFLAFAAPALVTPVLADVPRVAVDIVPTAALTARVMEGLGTPSLVVPPMASPHGYALRPSEAAALEQADVVIRIGPALAPWFEEATAALAPEATGLVLLDAPGTVLRALGEGHDHGDDDHGHEGEDDHGEDHAEHEDHGQDHGEDHAHAHDDHAHEEHAHPDHADGDHAHETAGAVEGPIDSHAWLDPRNGAVWMSAIAETLAAADPQNAATYRANAEAGAAELRALEEDLIAILAPLRDRPYLTLHDAYGYLEDRTGLDSAGSIRLSDAADAGPSHLSELRARLEVDGIACLFTEPQLDDRVARRLLEGTDIPLATLDPVGQEGDVGPGGYSSILRRMADSMAACLAP